MIKGSGQGVLKRKHILTPSTCALEPMAERETLCLRVSAFNHGLETRRGFLFIFFVFGKGVTVGRVLKDISSFLISQELEILNLVIQRVQYKHSPITYELFDF